MARLGDIATYINGYAFKPSDWSDNGLPIIRIQDLTGNSYQANRFNGKYDSKYEVYSGDVLISWSASLGVYVWNGEKALLNQHIFKVVFDKVDVDKSFYIHQLESILEKAKGDAHGATMKHLTKPVFDTLPFYLPNKEEQIRIATELDKVCNLITFRKDQLNTLETLVKSRFIEMFSNKGFPDTTIGSLVATKVPTAKKDFALTDTIKYIDISSIDNKRNVMTGFTEYVLEDAPSRAQQHIQKNDIVVSTVRPNLKNVAITSYDADNLVASSGFCVLRAEKCLPSYLMAIVCSDDFTDAMTKVVTGANYPAIKDSDVKNYVIPLPPIDLQNQFAEFVEQTDKLKFEIKEALEKLETLKKSLMQQYFG